METRIEIFRDGLWRQLRLRDEAVIKYNAVINRIGKLDVREISHTNTFSIPSIFQNTQALGLNFFNANDLAISLNSKFEAKYYVEDKLLQIGYIIINNTREGEINLNFIDESLQITDIWGSTSFKSLLTSISITRPTDYQTAIDEMVNYTMSKTSVLPNLSSIATRGHNLAYFPNNLNAIGDEFQLNDLGNRVGDVFNPYQSRPIFNVKALFDLACESFGYTPEYTQSINWKLIESTCMVDSGLEKSPKPSEVQETKTYNTVAANSYYYNSGLNFYCVFLYGTNAPTLRPIDVSGWSNPPTFLGTGYESSNCIFVPDISASVTGLISLDCEINPPPLSSSRFAYSIWEDTISPSGVIFKFLPFVTDNSTITTVSVQIDKAELNSPPANAGNFIGIIFQVKSTNEFSYMPNNLASMKTTEDIVPSDITIYDDYKQYGGEDINLTHAAPEESIKTLLSAYMQKEGMLMNINNKDKIIKFFTYNHYSTEKLAGNYYDWSKYLRKYDSPQYNTDYGGNYYKKNQIGLTDPYRGNSYYLTLNNQGVESKLKDAGSNLVKNFKDVENIASVNNLIVPYFEYKNTGLGLVEIGGNLSGLEQQRADGSSQGSLNPLKSVFNVNYTTPPQGVREWYDLVNSAVKAEAKFLLPINVVKELDLSKPVYVEDLGGFFIIEEVSEYVNAQTTVNVKLIKLTIEYPIIAFTYEFENSINFEFEDSEDYLFEDQ